MSKHYYKFSNPVKPEELVEAYSNGMVKKEDLVDRGYYSGHCRNASAAIWLASLNRFVYLRHKFGSSFAETIVHPADDEGFDIFTPEEKIDISVPEVFEKFKGSIPTAEDISYVLEHEIRCLRRTIADAGGKHDA